MNRRSHHRIGVAAGVGTVAAAGVTDTYPLAAGGIVVLAYTTSMLPDRLECGVLRHRGMTHWPETAFVVAAICGFLVAQWATSTVGLVVAVGVLVGYVSHLAADACTVSGVPFGPLLRVVCRTDRVWLLPRSLRINMHPRPRRR